MESEFNRILNENKLANLLKKKGFNFVTGIPCGVQKHIIRNFSQDKKIKHVQAVRESEAIGIAAGAVLSGKKSIVYMQNSGFFDSINDITSLLMTYKLPVLFLITWRGAPGEDAPQHLINGNIMPFILL